MKKIDQTWYLEVSKPFIEKYDLHHLLNHDPFYITWEDESTENYELPIDRFTFNLYYDETYFEQFIKRFEDFLEQFKIGNLIDELLFLSLLYKVNFQNKEEYNAWQKQLRDRAKVLYKFVSVNPYKISFDQARKLLIDSGEHENDIDEILTDYIYITLKEQNSVVDRNAISLSSVSKEIVDKAMHKIGKRYVMEVATSDKNLYLAGNTTSSIEFKIGKQKISLPSYHLETSIEQLVKSLYEEQKVHKTAFYKALMTFDFDTREGIKELEKSTKFNGLSSFHAFVILSHRSLLMKYLTENKVLSSLRKDVVDRKREDFIYQYFLFFNTLKPKSNCIKDINKLDEILTLFNKNKRSNPQFASTYFRNALKNISEKEETFGKRKRIQFV